MSVLTDRINADIKSAMIARDSFLTDVLKGLKTAVQYEDVAARAKGTELDDTAVEAVLAREAKKRDESAKLYDQGGNSELADKERREKAVIEQYLPQQLSDDELRAIIAEVAANEPNMGKVIGGVKARVGTSADGARIAALVREHLA